MSISAQLQRADSKELIEDKPLRTGWRTRRSHMLVLGIISGIILGSTFIVGTPDTKQAHAFLSEQFSRKPQVSGYCPTDPFDKPGALHIGSHPNETRWLPFPAGPSDPLTAPTLYSNTTIEYDFNDYREDDYDDPSPQYMRMLANRHSSMSWVMNRTVLLIDSSHDRDNSRFFCTNVDGKYTNVATQMFGFCRVPSHNFTIVTWFLYGMADGDWDWYAGGMAHPFPFEGRFEKMMLRTMDQHRIPSPDLIIESSLFWDERFLRERAVAVHRADTTAPLTHSEINWHRSRLYKLVAVTKDTFPRVPIMMRTRHFRRENSKNRILRIFQLDQNVRSVAGRNGLKLFRWGDLLEGQTENYHDKDHHFTNGPANWLWGDMLLFYLRRVVTPGCWQYHQARGD